MAKGLAGRLSVADEAVVAHAAVPVGHHRLVHWVVEQGVGAEVPLHTVACLDACGSSMGLVRGRSIRETPVFAQKASEVVMVT